MTRLYAYGIALAVLAGLLLAGGWWAHHKGAEAQEAKDAKVIEAQSQELTYTKNQLTAANRALVQVNDQAELEKKAAAAQRRMADAAVAEIAQERTKALAEAASWQKKFQAAVRSKDCAFVMEQTACPAVFKD
jgi:cbb3-type cytochrome oxidase subunit 3